MFRNSNDVSLETTRHEALRQQLLRLIVTKEAQRKVSRRRLLCRLGSRKPVPHNAAGGLPP